MTRSDSMMQIMLYSNYFSNANVEMETLITSFFFLLVASQMVQPDTWPPDSMGWFSSVLQGIQFSRCFVKFWTGMLVLGSGMTWLNWPRSQTGPYITCTVLYNACMNSSIVPFSFWHQVHQNFVMLVLQHLLNSMQREAWFSPHLLSKGLAATKYCDLFWAYLYGFTILC